MKLTLPLPPSVNSYWRIFKNRILLSREARQYKLGALMRAKTDGHTPLTGDVVVNLCVYRKRRIGDLDNFFKATLDALKGVAFEDDSQVVEIHAHRMDDAANPRVEVRVERAE
jgi:crossover junction endodeoxyribonuclease RusA